MENMEPEQNQETSIPQMVEELRAGKLPRRQFIRSLTAMGLTAAGATVVAAVAASRAFASKPAPVTHADESTKHIQLHQQHLAKQTQGDMGSLQNDYAPHAIVEDSMFNQPFVGRSAIMQRKSITALGDLSINVTNRVVQGSQLTVEWVATGTHTTDFPGMPATGRTFSIRGVTVVIRENGKIVRESIYYDMAEVKRQIGPQ